MSEVAIRVEGISKLYRIGARREKYRTLRDSLVQTATVPFRRMNEAFRGNRKKTDDQADSGTDSFWALKDVSFDIKCGEVVGVIGRNGAGKSTMLKVLSRITEPTEGYAEIHGRVGALLEVGTGFHQELTGRENVFLNGAILGMRREEIARKFDEIVSFAEIEKFIDTPVKRFSSGMYLRLAFAVAAHLEPEILLVDEVLAVGDATFQRKCLGKMQEVGQLGRTVLLVSHDLTAIANLASRTLMLQNGTLGFFGPTEEAIRLYTSQSHSAANSLTNRQDRIGDGLVRIESLGFRDRHGNPVDQICAGDPVTFLVGYHSNSSTLKIEEIGLDLRLNDVLGHPITTLSTRFSPVQNSGTLPQIGTLACHIPSLPLNEDIYSIDLWVGYRNATVDYVGCAGELHVIMSDYFGTGQAPNKRKHGATLVDHRWTLEDLAEPDHVKQPLATVGKN